MHNARHSTSRAKAVHAHRMVTTNKQMRYNEKNKVALTQQAQNMAWAGIP